MEKLFAGIFYKFSEIYFTPASCKTHVPVAQLESNILKKGGLQLKPRLYYYK